MLTISFVLTLGMLFFILLSVTRLPLGLKVIISIAYVLRLAYAWISYLQVPLSLDALSYHNSAEAALRAYQSGEVRDSNALFVGKEGWPILLEYVYRLVGPDPIAGIALNVTAATAVSIIVYMTCKLLGLSDSSSSVSSACALLPQFTIWSTLLLRESVTWLALASVCYFSVAITRRKHTTWGFVGLLISIAILFSFRASLAVIIGVALVLAAGFSSSSTLPVKIGTLSAALMSTPIVLGYLEESRLLDAERISMSRTELSAANTGFASTEAESLVSLAASLPESLARVSLGPFPWEVLNLGLFAAFEWVLWIVLFLPAVLALRRLDARSRTLVFLAVASMIALAFSITNYGTLARLRVMTAVILLPLVGVAWENRSWRIRRGRVKQEEYNL